MLIKSLNIFLYFMVSGFLNIVYNLIFRVNVLIFLGKVNFMIKGIGILGIGGNMFYWLMIMSFNN